MTAQPSELAREAIALAEAAKPRPWTDMIERLKVLGAFQSHAEAHYATIAAALLAANEMAERLSDDLGAMTRMNASLYDVLGGDVSPIEGARRMRDRAERAEKALRDVRPIVAKYCPSGLKIIDPLLIETVRMANGNILVIGPTSDPLVSTDYSMLIPDPAALAPQERET